MPIASREPGILNWGNDVLTELLPWGYHCGNQIISPFARTRSDVGLEDLTQWGYLVSGHHIHIGL
jgi:hypothetical protein